MKNITYLFIAIIFFSCQKKEDENESIKKQLDSITLVLNEIKSSLPKKIKDSLKSENDNKNSFISKKKDNKIKLTIKDSTQKNAPILVKKKPNEVRNKIVLQPKNDTIYHYYITKKLSVKIAPRAEKQKIWIYNQKGEITLVLENVRQSYSVYNDIYFRKDGSVEKIIEHLNPGASLYMYTTTMFFDESNQPKYKLVDKTPSTLEEQTNNKWLWNETKKQWIKQEIIIETNLPKEN